MPHKHRRDKSENSAHYELPPTVLAKPLPITKKHISDPKTSSKTPHPTKPINKSKSKSNALSDDTPRAFSRLMAFTKGIKPPSGLDDGRPTKLGKRKRSATEDLESANIAKPSKQVKPSVPSTTTTAASQPTLCILPGESLKDFSTRVNHMLPVAGLVGKGKLGSVPGVKVPQTRKEKKMQKMYAQWKEEDRRIKEKIAEKEDEEELDSGVEQGILARGSKKGKNGKRGGAGGEDSDDDPWAELARKKAAVTPSTGLVGLHDVVQAPPMFTKIPKDKFRGARVEFKDVPSKAGTVSLRRREELGEVRKGVLDAYRERMKGVRGKNI
ncbi:MAG: hypothetical protein MMC33_004572 [Icmadophila ericetorum]|nr:hypothetical protein [Icmadophila ericetorum]